MADYKELLNTALLKRSELLKNNETNAFRLFNGKGDGIHSVYIDLYGSYLLIQGYDDQSDYFIQNNQEILSDYAEGLPVEVKGILYKKRDEIASAQTKYDSALLKGDFPPEGYFVFQNNVKMNVDLIHGLNTGLFLDMRMVRAELKKIYGDVVSILNLFSYTGAFALHARLNGVQRAMNIDISNTVLKRAAKNYELNGISADSRDFIQEDSGKWLRRAGKAGKKWDFTVFDPPTFSKGKKSDFSIKKDYPEYLEMIDRVTDKYILSVINTHHISKQEYISMHPRSWSNVWISHESDDFVCTADTYLKVGLWRKSR